jgi:hypothetical protein
MKLQNMYGFDSILGDNNFLSYEGILFIVINIYGPYQDCVRYWENMIRKYFLTSDTLIMVGELNFSLGSAKVWGP